MDVPGVPGAFIVLDVFTPEECLQIVQAAEAIGFEKDEPAQGSATMKNSVSSPPDDNEGFGQRADGEDSRKEFRLAG